MILLTQRVDKVVSKAKCILTKDEKGSTMGPRSALKRLTVTAVTCSLAMPSARFFLWRLYNFQAMHMPNSF